MIGKTFGAFIMLVLLVALGGAASALQGSIDFVKMDGDELIPGTSSIVDYQRDDNYELRVKVTALENVKNAEIEAVLVAEDEDDRVSDVTDTFNLDAGNSVIKKLNLNFNHKIDPGRYTLRVYFRPGLGSEIVQTYTINIKQIKHNLAIAELDLDPSSQVEAGRSIRALVNVKNFGENDEDDVKIDVSIPDLGVRALPDYLDLKAEKAKSSEELYLRIPQCAKPGVYDVIATVTYDDGDEKVSVVRSIEVTASGVCSVSSPTTTGSQSTTDKPVISVGSQSQELVSGEGGAIYPLTFSNPTSSAKTYVLSIEGADTFADVRISPSNTIVVGAGASETVYVYVAAKDGASEGVHSFVASIKDASGNAISSISLLANVAKPAASTAKKVLETILIVLVVALVILGLVLAFKKMKGEGNNEETKDDYVAQTYY